MRNVAARERVRCSFWSGHPGLRGLLGLRVESSRDSVGTSTLSSRVMTAVAILSYTPLPLRRGDGQLLCQQSCAPRRCRMGAHCCPLPQTDDLSHALRLRLSDCMLSVHCQIFSDFSYTHVSARVMSGGSCGGTVDRRIYDVECSKSGPLQDCPKPQTLKFSHKI